MNEHRKKMIAPIVITIIFLLYLIGYGALIILCIPSDLVIVLLAIPLFAMGTGMVRILSSRIREIRSGEEDDLSNY